MKSSNGKNSDTTTATANTKKKNSPYLYKDILTSIGSPSSSSSINNISSDWTSSDRNDIWGTTYILSLFD